MTDFPPLVFCVYTYVLVEQSDLGGGGDIFVSETLSTKQNYFVSVHIEKITTCVTHLIEQSIRLGVSNSLLVSLYTDVYVTLIP